MSNHKQIFFEEMASLLRTKRAERNLSVEDIVNEMKFSKDIVLAMENANIERLPNTVYAKGFYRSYAELLQIDQSIIDAFIATAFIEKEPELVATPFLNIQMNPEKDENTFDSLVDKNHTRMQNRKFFIAILVVLIILFIIIYLLFFRKEEGIAPAVDSSAVVSQNEALTTSPPSVVEEKQVIAVRDDLPPLLRKPVKESKEPVPVAQEKKKTKSKKTPDKKESTPIKKENKKTTVKPVSQEKKKAVNETVKDVISNNEVTKAPTNTTESTSSNTVEKKSEVPLSEEKKASESSVEPKVGETKDSVSEEKNKNTEEVAQKPVANSTPKKKGKVKIVATGEVWIEAKYNGKTVNLLLQEGQTRTINFTDTASILVGDLSAAELYSGKKVLKNLGEKGKVKKFTFSADE